MVERRLRDLRSTGIDGLGAAMSGIRPRARRFIKSTAPPVIYWKSFSRSCPSTSALRTSCMAVARSLPFDSSACWMNVLIRSTVSRCAGVSDLPEACCSADRARERLCA